MKDRIFALIDCNNFFVSCERVFRPDLWNKPVVVLSNNDGCIVARSNEVKTLGVPMGVPLFKVRQILEDHQVVQFSGNFPLYGDFSQRVVQTLQTVCPSIEVYSVDESFADITQLPITDYQAWALALRQKILQWTGIPVSIGIASTKTLAKAAAEYAKQTPDTSGVYSLIPDQVQDKTTALRIWQELLKWLPLSDVWGIGRRSAPKLRQLGLSTAYDLIGVRDGWARKQLSIRGLYTIKELRQESCFHITETHEPQQSIMHTRSFGYNVRNYLELEGAIATFTARAAASLRQQQEVAKAVLVFLRPSRQFELGWRGVSTVMKLPQPTSDTGSLLHASLSALERLYDPELSYKKAGVVLLGLGINEQLAMWGATPDEIDRKRQLMKTVDELNKRFGTQLVRHASEHPELKGWHSLRQRRSKAYTTNWHELPIVR